MQSETMDKRRKRVNRIKKYIVFLCVVLLIAPNVISVFLLLKVQSIEKSLNELQAYVNSNQQSSTQTVEQKSATALPKDAETEITIEEQESSLKEKLSDEEAYPDKTLVYLTFDDGPSKYTDDILDVCEQYQVKVSFFVVAKEGFDEQYLRIVSEGHTLGLHSYSHKYSDIYKDVTSFQTDVIGLQDYVEGITGQKSTYYRFPGGSSNSIANDMQDMITYLNDEKFTYFDWNVTSKDASTSKLTVNQIVDNVMTGIEGQRTAIVLMHDAADKNTTVEALPILLDKLQSREDTVILPITDTTVPVQHVIANEQ